MTICSENNSCHERFSVIASTIAVSVSVNAIGCSCKRDLKRSIYRCSCVLGSLDKSCPAVLRRFINNIVTVKVPESGTAGYCAKVRFYNSCAAISLINTENDALTSIAVRKVISRRCCNFLNDISSHGSIIFRTSVVSPVISLSTGNCISL